MISVSQLSLLVVLTLADIGHGQSYPECKKQGDAFCASESLQGNIIFRCAQSSGTAQPGNCWRNAMSNEALCWQSSPTAGDAKCVKDCTQVTAANGTVFYPVGCSSDDEDGGDSDGSPTDSTSQASTVSSVTSSLTSSEGIYSILPVPVSSTDSADSSITSSSSTTSQPASATSISSIISTSLSKSSNGQATATASASATTSSSAASSVKQRNIQWSALLIKIITAAAAQLALF